MTFFLPRAVALRAALSCLFVTLAVGPVEKVLLAQAPPSAAVAQKQAPDYSQEALIIESSVTEVAFENDGTSLQRVSRRVRVQSQAGVQAMAVLSVMYANATESAAYTSVRVRKPDGSEVVTPPDQTQDVTPAITQQAPMYSDLKEKHLSVKGLGVGDTLEFAFTVRRTKPLAPGKYWLDFSFLRTNIVLSEVLSVNAPEGPSLRWSSPGEKPTTAHANGRQTIVWMHSQTSLPTAEEQQKEAQQLARKAQRGLLPHDDILLSNFTSWAEVGAWYRELEKDRIQSSPPIAEKAAQLTKGLGTPQEKAAAIYEYVSTQVHYIGVDVGIGRIQPHPAAEVLANQYGDCKDKHTLLAALLSAAGIPSSAVLIGASHALDPEIPSPTQFDHVISQIHVGDTTVWADTTSGAAPFGYLLSVLRGKQALLVASEGAPALVLTPLDPPARSVQTFRIEAKLDNAGTLDGKARQSFMGGDSQVVLAAGFGAVAPAQHQDIVQGFSMAQGFGGTVSGVRIEPLSPEKPFEFSYSYNRKDYPDWARHRINAPLPAVEFADTEEKPVDGVWLGSPTERIFEASVAVPDSYQPFLPPAIHLIEPFAEFHREFKFQGGKLITTRRVITKEHEVAPADWERYQKFAKAVAADYDRKVELVTENQSRALYRQEEIWDLPLSENKEANQGYDDAVAKFKARDTAGEIAALSNAVKIDPHYIRAWLWLGEIQRDVGQSNEAAAAYRGAIAADAGNGLGYKALAFLLMQQRKEDEEAAVLKTLTLVEPENAFAWYALGATLLDLHKTEDARTALAEAVRLNPDWGTPHLSLARVEMSTGAQKEAEADFKIALGAVPSAFSLNEVAYQLAQAGVGLPTALDYAQRAVKETEERSARLQLSGSGPALSTNAPEWKEAVSANWALAAYWDTLGWVLFKMGKDAEAKKYLTAAWDVSRRSEIGDHLSRLSERMGDPVAALEWADFATGLASDQDRAALQARVSLLSKKAAGSSQTGRHSHPATASMAPAELVGITEKRRDVAFVIVLKQEKGAPAVTVESATQAGGEPWPEAQTAIKKAKFGFHLPTEGVRAIFDGTASCSETGQCSLSIFPIVEHLPPGLNLG